MQFQYKFDPLTDTSSDLCGRKRVFPINEIFSLVSENENSGEIAKLLYY